MAYAGRDGGDGGFAWGPLSCVPVLFSLTDSQPSFRSLPPLALPCAFSVLLLSAHALSCASVRHLPPPLRRKSRDPLRFHCTGHWSSGCVPVVPPSYEFTFFSFPLFYFWPSAYYSDFLFLRNFITLHLSFETFHLLFMPRHELFCLSQPSSPFSCYSL